MRTLINYLRQCFCAHKWEYEEIGATERFGARVIQAGPKVSDTCEKCGYHRSYWKF